jgi:hypothetical protein
MMPVWPDSSRSRRLGQAARGVEIERHHPQNKAADVLEIAVHDRGGVVIGHRPGHRMAHGGLEPRVGAHRLDAVLGEAHLGPALLDRPRSVVRRTQTFMPLRTVSASRPKIAT